MIYIHIPFCKSRCLYCDFFSSTSSSFKEDYVKALLNEMENRSDELYRARANTIYIGGGTPSQLEVDQIKQIFTFLTRIVPLEHDAEVTIECNPDDITEGFIAGLRETPVNRVSMGVQTFDDSLLRFLKRRHSSHQALKAVAMLQGAGYDNLSLDLMYGLPGQTMKLWTQDVDTLLSLGVPHISAYSLQWEEGTPLYRMLESGEAHEASDELSFEMYQYLVEATSIAGMEHYEISNYAKPGMRAKHNSGYWRDEAYVGLGPAAHSFDGINVRSSNPSDLKSYISLAGVVDRDVEILTEDDLYEEQVLKRLRTIEGLDLSKFTPRYRDYALKMVKPHIEAERVVLSGNTLKLTQKGVFVSNDIMSDMML